MISIELIFLFNNSSSEWFFNAFLDDKIFSPVTNSAGEPDPIPHIPFSNSIWTNIFSTESIVSYDILYGRVSFKFSDQNLIFWFS